MRLRGLSLIADQPGTVSVHGFHAHNPADGNELPPTYYAATAAELDRAARCAAEAFAVYRHIPGPERGNFLRCIADEIEALGELLLLRYVKETGLTLGRAESERARTCGQLRMFAQLATEGSWVDARIDHAQPRRVPVSKPDLRSLLQPIGPVAVFGPANFPLAFSVAGGDTASALAAGCPVIAKAHSSHPGVAEYVGLAVQNAVATCGLPAGVFSLLFGGGREIGTALVQHPAIQGVGFTGSRQAGVGMFHLCQQRPQPIPFFGELSSLNPVVLLPERMQDNLEALAAGLHASITLGVGQFCTCPGLVLLPRGEGTRSLVGKLGALMAATPAGTMLNAATCRGYGVAVDRMRARGAEVVAEGPAGSASGAQAPAVLLSAKLDRFLADPAWHEEMFGPASLLLEYESPDELPAFAAALEGHLTASIHGTPGDLRTHAGLIALLATKVGRIVFNGFPTGVEVCPSMVHGGPWPATTDGRFTSVGTGAIRRWARPVCYQNAPDEVLPPELREANPAGIVRQVEGKTMLPPAVIQT